MIRRGQLILRRLTSSRIPTLARSAYITAPQDRVLCAARSQGKQQRGTSALCAEDGMYAGGKIISLVALIANQ